MHCENSRAVCEGSLTGEKKSLAGSREGQKRGFKVWEGWWPGSTSPGKFVDMECLLFCLGNSTSKNTWLFVT